jgi:hypothetical protein
MGRRGEAHLTLLDASPFLRVTPSPRLYFDFKVGIVGAGDET